MSVVNKRNALLGWVVWMAAKRTARKKVSNALPDGNGVGGGRRLLLAVPAAAAALAGGLLFWRNRQNGDDEHRPDE